MPTGKCEAEVIAQCRDLLRRGLDYGAEDEAGFLDAAQNARLIASAERYYRIMYYGGAESWNLRDTHMFETLEHLLKAGGPQAKAVVWAHNSHIGDARHTDMGQVRGELNIGQLCRERFGDGAALIGFGTHSGTVAAASAWGGEMEVKRVRPSHRDSYERVCHDTDVGRLLLHLGDDGAARRSLMVSRLERFIGVIYRPETELRSHYAEAACRSSSALGSGSTSGRQPRLAPPTPPPMFQVSMGAIQSVLVICGAMIVVTQIASMLRLLRTAPSDVPILLAAVAAVLASGVLLPPGPQATVRLAVTGLTDPGRV